MRVPIKKSRRNYLLLEVMIAFAILAIAAIPLIYPHLMILKEEKVLIEELNFDLAAKNLITGLIVDLYENNVPFNLIEDKGTLEVPVDKLAGFPPGAIERAYFKFDDEQHKPHEPAKETLYNVDAHLHLIYSPLYKERLRREDSKYPVSFNVMRVNSREENEKN